MWFKGGRLHSKLAAKLGNTIHVVLALEALRIHDQRGEEIFLHSEGETLTSGYIWQGSQCMKALRGQGALKDHFLNL